MTRKALRFAVEVACGALAVYLSLGVFGLIEWCAGCGRVWVCR